MTKGNAEKTVRHAERSVARAEELAQAGEMRRAYIYLEWAREAVQQLPAKTRAERATVAELGAHIEARAVARNIVDPY